MLQTARKTKPPPPTPMGKTAILIDLLTIGSSVEALTKATGWQAHSLRARISGLAKPPFSLLVARERKDGVTLYKII